MSKEMCHCGSEVSDVTSPGVFANRNMTPYFCDECITVRCDAYPGACRGEYRG